MRLSFFTKPDGVVEEITFCLEQAGFQVTKNGKPKGRQIVFFNGRNSNNFSYCGHKLLEKAPNYAENCPFLIRVGNDWTLQGLTQILTRYAKFQLPHFSKSHFPDKKDFEQPAEEDQMLMSRLAGIEGVIERHAQENKRIFTDCQQKKLFRAVKAFTDAKSVGQVKESIFKFLLKSGRIKLPWGNPPEETNSLRQLIEWLEKANEVFPRKKSNFRQYNKDVARIRRIEKLKDAQAVKLT